jgi:alkylation response protein AidB-like acyl-CoA dehydrogenase
VSLHELTPEQQEIRALARRFADERIAPHAAAWDRDHHFPRELFAELGELGLMGACVPVEQGGAGADFLAYVQVLEELSRADAGVGVTVAVHTSACTLPLLDHGSEYVPALASGEEIGAFALTEAGSGSDASAMRSRYADGAITGNKQWITNGSYASTFLVFAREDERISAFVVRAGADGFSVTREEDKLGLNSSSTADIVFEGTPAERLGEPGKGMSIALRTLDAGRIGIAAQAVGIGQAALDLATAYAKERNAFGGPIAKLGSIQQKLADMQTEVEAARALTWRAARLKDAGRPHTVEGAQAKLFASGVARRQTGEAIQVLGGYGYTKEFPAERYYRDAKVTEIYEGTSEIQRLVIARALLGEAARG